MNYPIWDLPASGLLIAFVAIVHVFVSHFAVGGGLFLVLTERKARRESDAALLDYVKSHTRFFVLLTLVFGAMTGVGIWFTIGLVHPAATSSLIAAFVWGWAIEWTFFVVEIAAAMVYFYGWDRLPARTHMAVGWIYVWSAWLSLVVINGILTFMLTPGAWLDSYGFWAGILNPTYLPAVFARTFGAVGLAGVYAVFTASRVNDAALKERIARYAVTKWIAPMAVLLPVSMIWTLQAAAAAGVPVAEILGATGTSFIAVIARGADTGQPIAQLATRALFVACLAALLFAGAVLRRRRAYGRLLAGSLMASAFVALGAAEWLREDLRKPYVIGHYMFVNGVRLPGAGTPVGDRFTVDALNETGVLKAAVWSRLQKGSSEASQGEEVFRLLCRSCHTVDGYLAVRPLVRNASVSTTEAMLGRLAAPASGGRWTEPRPALRTWRGRRMPPFVGTPEERHALAVYLASLGGATGEAPGPAPAADNAGARFFSDNCSMCHGPDADFPFDARGRDAKAFYEILGRLPAIDDAMPPFEGTDAERRALADHLTTLNPAAKEAVR